MMEKKPTISLCLIGKNEQNYFLKEVLDSALKFVDEIIYVDTGSDDDTLQFLKKEYPYPIVKIYCKDFKNPQDYTTVKNFAISKATKDYILSTDCDEVFDGNCSQIKDIISQDKSIDMWCLVGVHYMGDLVHKDQMINIHIWQNRLFKNNKKIKYNDGTMHGLAEGFEKKAFVNVVTLHHYGFCKNMIDALRRFETNINDPIQDREQFLKWQYWCMITGTFPGQPVEAYPINYYTGTLLSHPEEIKKKFHINEIVAFKLNG